MKRLKNLNERRPRKKGYFLCKRKIISKSRGKQARMESLHGKIYRDKKPADPAVPQRAMIFFIPDWSLPGVLDGAVERKSSQHRHQVDHSALHVWLRLPITVVFEFDAQCPYGPLSISPLFTRHIQVQKQVTLRKCINN